MTESENKALEIVKFAHEQEAVRQERTIKRLWVLCIILIALLAISNIGWIIYESQFEDVVETTQIEAEQEADGNGSNYIVGGDYYGEADSESNENYETESEEVE